MSFLEIFQPGLKHLREEKDRQRMLVVRPKHGGGAPLGIDLDGGTATIKIEHVKTAQRQDEPRARSPETVSVAEPERTQQGEHAG